MATTDSSVTLNAPLSEFLEGDTVREALSTDADPLQNSITPQLVQHQGRGQLPSLTEQDKLYHCLSFEAIFLSFGYVNMSALTICSPLSYPFLVVWDDTAQEVGVRVPQRGHQLGERLLVELADCPEHSLLGLESGRSECDRPTVVPC